ncbi:MAG TPA: outer membrane lipoprotein-sorting protein [bacterium]|nr:outer membrane lipoprotein-sorting protein [bacterium]
MSLRHPFVVSGLILGFFCSPVLLAARPVDLSATLTKVDYILTAKGSYDYDATIEVRRGNAVAQEFELQVQVQDPLHRRIVVQKPIPEAGQSLLLEGEKYWLYLPKLKKAVRIPPQVEFAGELSSSDLAQPFFSMAYQAVGMDSAEWQGRPAYVLRLKSRLKDAGYTRVKLWIDQADSSPLQAEFFDARNVLIKTCLYQDYQEELGMKRPRRWVYRDALQPENETILAMKKMTQKNFNPAAFEPTAQPKLFNSAEARPKSASDPTPRRRRAGPPLP